jgi:hypothetical protein
MDQVQVPSADLVYTTAPAVHVTWPVAASAIALTVTVGLVIVAEDAVEVSRAIVTLQDWSEVGAQAGNSMKRVEPEV